MILVLTDAQVEQLLDMPAAVAAVEDAFVRFSSGEAVMPAKLYLEFKKHSGDLRVMPSASGDEFAGVKLVNSHPGNPSRGLPTVTGTYLLFSQQTGMPLALIAATALTAIRTGAASAVATKYLARSGAVTVGLIGAGVQAGYQLRAIAAVREIAAVKVWGPPGDSARTGEFTARLAADYPAVPIHTAGEVSEATAAGVVCTTTPVRSPIINSSDIAPGTHINAVGADAPGKQELDPAILQNATVIVDEMHQAVSGGEVNVAISSGVYDRALISGELGEVVTKKVPGRTSDDEITVFDSTGLAIEDLAAATLVYQKALAENIGSRIEL